METEMWMNLLTLQTVGVRLSQARGSANLC